MHFVGTKPWEFSSAHSSWHTLWWQYHSRGRLLVIGSPQLAIADSRFSGWVADAFELVARFDLLDARASAPWLPPDAAATIGALQPTCTRANPRTLGQRNASGSSSTVIGGDEAARARAILASCL
mmetsp:Transcript_29884/g.68534  ORF Transcript_29884/g.68534 Transcript_29884/m.68534 type:complete len:125 (-) Transcript_29884:305-679(-)